MALVPVVRYRLSFSTNTGQNTEWELDILRTYDDVDGVPSWVDDPTYPRDLVGTGSPIEIEWERDYDVYKPIIGSSANINLLVQNAGEYDDFNDIGPYEYQARLQYTDENDVMQDYWCGYMTPLDGKEDVSTFPFPVSFTATDGLGLLEQARAPIPTTTVSTKPWDAVTQALIQTGLSADIYLDSGIRIGDGGTPEVFTEALSEVTIDPDWVYDGGRDIRLTYKEQIEGVLSAFNCTIKQSNGKWYITNASTYGGTNDSVTFDVYNVVTNVYVKNATPVTEQVRYTIDGSETQALVPANDDLVLNTRRPYGSIECKPEGFFQEDVTNGGFEVVNTNSSPVGWSPGPTVTPNLQTTEQFRQAGTRSIFTEHSTFKLDTANDIWFTNEVGIDVDSSVPIEISFDWAAEILDIEDTDGVRNVKLAYDVIFVPDVPETIYTIDIGATLLLPGLLPVPQQITGNAIYYKPRAEEYRAREDDSLYGARRFTQVEEGPEYLRKEDEYVNTGEWLSASLSMPAIEVWDYNPFDFGRQSVGTGKLYIRFYYPRGQRPRGDSRHIYRGNRDGSIRVYVDNISVKNMYTDLMTDPTFERVQENYTSTYEYEPRIASSTSSSLVQTINQKEYLRTISPLDPDNSDIPVDVTTRKSLERIGTQLKLNDFRSQFKYYEGSLVNLN